MADHGRSPFGAVLRRLRMRAGLSQDQLAERARMSTDGVGALERGTRRAPYRETVEMLADALGVLDAEREELHFAARRPRRLPDTPSATLEIVEPQAAPNNLPPEPTTLRGRERVLADCRALMQSRLLTIIGSGGVGKTRIAVALGRELATSEALDGVWFFPLEALSSGDLVATTAAQILGATLPAESLPEETIAQTLAQRRAVLVFDNCEHVTDSVASLAQAILRTCPNVRILVTSRRPLGIAAEATYRLPSLDVPPLNANLQAATALEYGAIALFVDRAQAADSAFLLTDDGASIVADICRRLDGIALAIELAAARVKVLSLPSVAKHLDERFRLLTAGGTGVMARQRTLSALIDWSYDLLSPVERRTLDRTAIFSGGFDLEAAHAVCADQAADLYDVLDVLTSLIDQSLVIVETARDKERFRLLESTRAYASERLEADEEVGDIARRHAEHFAARARAADATYGTISGAAWLAALEPDTDNFRRSLTWAVTERNDVPLGAEIAGALERFWINGGLEIEGRRRIAEVVERIDEAKHLRVAARVWRASAWLEMAQRKYAAAEHACDLYAKVPDPAGMGDSLRQLAIGAAQMGLVEEALGANERALAMLRGHGDRRLIANCLDLQGSLAKLQGRAAESKAAYEEALVHFRAIASEGGVASVLVGLSDSAFIDGDTRQALRLLKEANAIRRKGKNASNLVTDATMLCAYHTLLGELPEAQAALETALHGARVAGSAVLVALALLQAAVLRASSGDIDDAARLMGYATAARARLHLQDDISERRLKETYDRRVRERLDALTLAARETEGASWTEERAIEEALRTTNA